MDRLRRLWDFGDLEASEERLQAQLSSEPRCEGRAEVLTQLARVEGLRGDFEAGERLVEEAETLAGDNALARARIALERGRLRRSSGDAPGALPLFESAYATARDGGAWFIAADAAHMAALAAPGSDGVRTWTERGLELAEAHEAASYWLGPLLNNLGWHFYEAGAHEEALDAFERALRARERDPSDEEGSALARYAVGKALRALDRSDDAVPLLEAAVAWAEREGRPDGWFHEELALEYEAVGRLEDAREQARLALRLSRRTIPPSLATGSAPPACRPSPAPQRDRMAEPSLRTALIVAVPEAGAATDAWRERTSTAKPSAGVPAHVTVLFPFVPASEVDDSLLAELRTLFSRVESFSFTLETTARFDGVLYLAPRPALRFERLTRAVWRAYPGYPPYGGAFDEVIPHLTAAEGDTATLDRAETELLRTLPIAAHAHEVVLLEEVEPDFARWRARWAFPLGTG